MNDIEELDPGHESWDPQTPIVIPKGLKIGVALGSGSARGWAHIGILKALDRLGIRPACISGCSVGALVGAAYAGGYLDSFELWARSLKWHDVAASMKLGLGGGLIKSQRLLALLRHYNHGRHIEELDIPFAAVATRLDNGKEVWLRKGSVVNSVKASAAFPGLFSAVHMNNTWLIDGGLVNPVPVSLCVAMGADFVIAADLNLHLIGTYLQKKSSPETLNDADNTKGNGFWKKISGYLSSEQSQGITPPGMMQVMTTAVNIMQYRITRGRMSGNPPDMLLAPQLGHFGMLDFHRADEAIAEGEAVVHDALRRLRYMLEAPTQ